MDIIICIDKNFGVAFNDRRLSRDKLIIKDIIESFNTVAISDFSVKLFEDFENKVQVVSDFSHLKIPCFIEKDDLLAFENNIDKLTVYKFDTVYPSDKKLKIDLNKLKLISQMEFVGNSHDKIIKEVYAK